MKVRSTFGAIVLIVDLAGLSVSAWQARDAARVFKVALDELHGRTPIPIMLPTKLPKAIPEANIKLAVGTPSDHGYDIELYYMEIGSGGSYAAGFSGSTQLVNLADLRPVKLANGIVARFDPISCGGSCTSANLYWQRGAVMYGIQLKLPSTTTESEQERMLVETANLCVVVGK